MDPFVVLIDCGDEHCRVDWQSLQREWRSTRVWSVFQVRRVWRLTEEVKHERQSKKRGRLARRILKSESMRENKESSKLSARYKIVAGQLGDRSRPCSML